MRWMTYVMAIGAATASAAGQNPVGPELAGREIGVLLRAHPSVFQTNPLLPQGPMGWSCEYQVGRAQITLMIMVNVGDPMPCKRKVAFG